MGAAPIKQLSKTKSVNPHKTLSKQHFQVCASHYFYFYFYLVMIGLLYKATLMVASIGLGFLLRLRTHTP